MDARMGSKYTSNHDLNRDLIILQFIQNFIFFNDIVSVNKKELDFSLIWCNAICDQCIYFLFIAT